MGSRTAYDWLGEVGRGSFGVVHKVQRKSDKRMCVCKQVPMRHFKTDQERSRALQEAQLQKQMTCPHIVEYIDAFIDDKTKNLHLVLGYCQMGDLATHLKKTGVLPEKTIWRITLRISLGLEYLHSRRVLHRDLKSENVFLTGPDAIRIGDLGLGKMLTNTADGASTLCGTPRYFSPEEADASSKYNEKCDTWALGVIMYELCSDNHRGPFDEAKTLPVLLLKIMNSEPPPLPGRTPPAVKEAVTKLLCKNPKDRPGAAELVEMYHEQAIAHNVIEKSGRANLEIAPGLESRQNSNVSGNPGDDSGGARDANRCSMCEWLTGDVEPILGPRFHRKETCELCTAQGVPAESCTFGMLSNMRHHCHSCGRSVCGEHSKSKRDLPDYGFTKPMRICEVCNFMPAACSDNTNQKPLVIASAPNNKVYVWDSGSNAQESKWNHGKGLAWVGLARNGEKGERAVCMLGSELSLGLPMHSLESGTALCTIPPPKASVLASQAQSAKSGGLLAGVQATLRAGIGGTIGDVTMAASQHNWLALAYGSRAKPVVQVLQIPLGEVLGNVAGLSEPPACLAVQSGSDGFAVLGAGDGSVRVWTVPGADEQCMLRSVLQGHTGGITTIACGGNGSFICTGSKDNTVRVWRSKKKGEKFEPGIPEVCDDYAFTGPSSVCCDGPYLVFVKAPLAGQSTNHGASLWNMALGTWERSFYSRSHSVRAVALGGALLATTEGRATHRACSIQLWHAPTGTFLRAIQNPESIQYLMIAELEENSQPSRMSW